MKSNKNKKRNESYRILIVHEDRDICHSIYQALINNGVACDKTNSGLDALRLLHLETYDMVVCAISMRDFNGVDCMKTAIKANVHVPFVFVAGFGDGDAMTELISLGALDFITKPFDTEDVSRVIERGLAIESSRKMKQDEIESGDQKLLTSIFADEKMRDLMLLHGTKKRL